MSLGARCSLIDISFTLRGFCSVRRLEVVPCLGCVLSVILRSIFVLRIGIDLILRL